MSIATSPRPKPEAIPDHPGVYLFRDAAGRAIYVGKAISLRKRLASYFQPLRNLHPRTAAMVDASRALEWVLVRSEVEALQLEYNLIKQHRPRYNVRYRDDKSYPWLAVTVSEEFPRPRVERGAKRKGTRYFGPYAHASAIRETLDLLLRTFPMRTCSQGVFDRQRRLGRPCILYDISKCSGPCVGHISAEDHREIVEEFIAFMEGRSRPVLRRLEDEMREAAEQLNFETAARLRDQLALTGAFAPMDGLELFVSWRTVRLDRDVRPTFVPTDPTFGGVSHEYPYLRRGWSKTLGGPVIAGLKYSLLSQSRGDAMALAPRVMVKFPSGSTWASTND